jgi:hypothetical protein
MSGVFLEEGSAMTTAPTRTPAVDRAGARAPGARRSAPHVLGAASGAAYVVLVVVGNGLYTGGANESVAFGVEMLGYVALASFTAYVAAALRGSRPWAATLALFGGATMLAVKLSGWASVLAAKQSEVAADTAAALIQVDEMAFVLGWLPHGLFVIGLAAAGVIAGRLPRWLGWVGGVIGLTEILAVIAAAQEPVVIPYLLSLLWIIAASLLLAFRGRRQETPWAVEV